MNTTALQNRLQARKALGMTAEQYNKELENRVTTLRRHMHVALGNEIRCHAALRTCPFFERDSMARSADQYGQDAVLYELALAEAKEDVKRGYALADLEK